MSAVAVNNNAPTASRADDVRRWMATERDMKANSARYREEKAARIEAMAEDDAARIAEVFKLFDYDGHKYLPMADLGMVLRAIGCDDATCAATTTLSSFSSSASSSAQQQTFTLEDLLPTALKALAVGRDGFSEASTREAFRRFCTPSYGAGPSPSNGGAADANATESAGPLALDLAGLKAAFAHCGARVAEDELAELLSYADLDGDGIVGEDDWMEIMRFVVDTQ